MSETRCPFAIWRGPIPNMTPGGQHRPARGLVLHVEVGTEEGTDGWFHNPKAQASADFGVAYDGTLHEWVGLADKAWAQSFYNPDWYSVETEGQPSEPLTDAQVATCGRLLLWLSQQDGFAIQVTDDPNGQGLITHGDLGQAGGGHYGCPGDLRAAQRGAIVDAALGAVPAPPPPLPDLSTEIDMLIIQHAGTDYLCDGIRLIALGDLADAKMPRLAVPDDATWERLIVAYGKPIA